MADDFITRRNARGRNESDAYIEEFLAAAVRRLARGKHARIHKDDRDDIAARMVTRVLPNLDDLRRRYPKADKLATVMLDQAVIGYRRAEGAQRGEGARHTRKVHFLADPELPTKAQEDAPRLTVEGDYKATRRRRNFRADLATSLTAASSDGQDDYLAVDSPRDECRLLEAALLGRGVDQRGRHLLRRVDGDGLSVTEAARELGIARETAQRALGKARKAASAAADQWRADGRPLPW